MVRTVVTMDVDIKERIKPYLKRQGLTLSSFIRREMADFVEMWDMEKLDAERLKEK